MRRFLVALLLFSGALEVGCGGGGGSTVPTSPQQPSTPSVVTLTEMSPTTFNGTKDVEFSAITSLNFFNSPVTPPYHWSITSGSLPPGIQALGGGTNPPNFVFKGTPTTAGTYSITLEVTDSSSSAKLIARQTITFVIDAAFKFARAGLREGVIGVPYTDSVTAVNGVAPLQYSVVAQRLPMGLQLNASTGVISGTPTDSPIPFTIQATDSSSPAKTVRQDFYIHVNPALTFQDANFHLYRGVRGTLLLSILGGVRPYTVTVASGSIPPGVQISEDDLVGTPTVDGIYTVVLQAADSYSPSNTKQATIQINVTEPPPHVLTRYLPHAVVGQPYSYQLAATDGLRPYTWQNFGSLPAGITLAADGLLSGTPTSAYTAYFYAQASDSTSPPQSSQSQALVLDARPFGTGRNDSIATATPISNGSYQGSLSPYANASGIAQPDQDFYRISANGGAQVTVEANKQYVNAGMDPVLEILDSSGARMTTCRNRGTTDGLTPGTVDPTPNAFDDPCVNDDIDPGVNQNAYLELLVPGSGPQTIYLRVLDLNGRARPDMKYFLNVSGAN